MSGQHKPLKASQMYLIAIGTLMGGIVAGSVLSDVLGGLLDIAALIFLIVAIVKTFKEK